jgi:hypothetical protein
MTSFNVFSDLQGLVEDGADGISSLFNWGSQRASDWVDPDTGLTVPSSKGSGGGSIAKMALDAFGSASGAKGKPDGSDYSQSYGVKLPEQKYATSFQAGKTGPIASENPFQLQREWIDRLSTFAKISRETSGSKPSLG